MLRNGIRTLAIALIAFPEPVSTALGIVILCATFAVPGQASLKQFGDMDILIKRSLVNPEAEGFQRRFANKPPSMRHTLTASLPVQHTNYSPKRDLESVSPYNNPWFDNRKVSQTVLHHTLKTSFPQYEAMPDSSRHNRRVLTNSEAVFHHRLKSS